MAARDDPEEIEVLPAGMSRKYAEYVPAADLSPVGRPTHVAGYDDLTNLLQSAGVSVTRDPADLDVLDTFVATNRAVFEADERMVRQVGMFYGDVLTHAIERSYWRVIQEGYPEVVVSEEVAVSVILVSNAQVTAAGHNLAANYAHLCELLAERDGSNR